MEELKTATSSLPTYRKAALQVLAYKSIRDIVNAVLTKFELNTTQWIILGILYESATGLRITDIAKDLQVEVPLITNLTQPMLSHGLIRNRISKTDRRAKPVAITKSGRTMVSRIEAQLALHLAPIEEGLSDEEVTSYFETLSVFIGNAEAANS